MPDVRVRLAQLNLRQRLSATRRGLRRYRRKILLGFAALLLLFFAIPPRLLQDVPFSRAVYDRDGKLLHLTLAKDEKYRLYVPLSALSSTLADATLVYEDQHFYDHWGVNPLSLGRAALGNLTGKSWIGASTITMQLARLKYGLHTRNPFGKVWQMLCALRIELHHSKAEILEAYLNLAPYGYNIEGVGAASLIYFQRPPNQLNLLEALSLTVLPQSPSSRAPHLRPDNLKSLHRARARLLARWEIEHTVPPEQKSLFALPLRYTTPRDLVREAPHATNALLAKYPKEQSIVSTLDLSLQRLLTRLAEGYIRAHRSEGIENAAALIVDTRTMQAVARLGSADFNDAAIQGQVDGTRARRSPGSTLKPFIYALGMQEGIIHPLSLMKDSPAAYAGYVPDNFDSQFQGPLSATEALVRSRNLPALALTAQLKKPSFYNFLQSAHIGKLKPEATYGLSLVLGGAEVTMEELAALYAMLPNLGQWQPLQSVLKPAPAVHAPERLLSAESAFLVMDMLRQNPRPQSDALGSRAQGRDSLPIYWKTGTSNALRDAWTVGIVGPYALVVWIGQFQGKASGQFVGIKHAAPLFFQITDALTAGHALQDRVMSKASELKLTRLPICADTGDVNEPLCPTAVQGWFIPGVSPIQSSHIYRRVALDAGTGLRACPEHTGRVIEKTLAFWPSDLLEIYTLAGVPKTTPPPFEPGCSEADTGSSHTASALPAILSPASGSVMHMVEGQPNTLSLKAATEADAQSVFWFLDAEPLGHVPPNQALLWSMKPGKFHLRVVDDRGRSAERAILIEP